MSDITCALCGAGTDSKHTTVLTDEEKALTGNTVESFTYCEPCHNIMQDPQAATSLIASLIEGNLRAFGAQPSVKDVKELKLKLLEMATKIK
jgi:hypothetical protein